MYREVLSPYQKNVGKLIMFIIKIISSLKLFIINLMFFCTVAAQNHGYTLYPAAQSEVRWTGIAVSKEGRIFTNYPRWDSVPYSVTEIIQGNFKPYPDSIWNNYDTTITPRNMFCCVQSLYIDDENFLWILDAGTPYYSTVVPGGAKLLKVDLSIDKIIDIYYFEDGDVLPDSYLNDIRVDTGRDYAFLTDSRLGAILVLNLNTHDCSRVLDDHFSTKSENIKLSINGRSVSSQVHSDGLALDPVRKYLYYKALSGYNLYRIPVEKLIELKNNKALMGEAVEPVKYTVASDAIEFDNDNNLYFTSIEDNSIWKLTPELNLEQIVADDRLKWPDSFSITSKGEIYVTTSRLAFPPGIYELFKIVKNSGNHN